MAKHLVKVQVEVWNGFGSYYISQSEKSGRGIVAVFQNMNQKRSFLGVDDPVFLYAWFLVDVIFVLQLLPIVPRRKDFYDQVWSAYASQLVQLFRITDHADIRLHNSVNIFIL